MFDHDAINLLYNNPAMSSEELFKRTSYGLDLCGEAYWEIDENNTRLDFLHPQYMEPVIEDGALVGWKYKGEKIPVERVIYFIDPSPHSDIKGLSKLATGV